MKYSVSVVDANNDIKGAVAGSLGLIGWSPSKGEKMLVKPNMITAKTSEQGVTTDPRIVKALVELLKENGAIPSVGDSLEALILGEHQRSSRRQACFRL